MKELDALLLARAGRADFTTDRLLTELGRGKFPLWELEYMGEKPCEPYIAHGGFQITTKPVFRSVLTAKGRQRLHVLEREFAA